MVSVYFFIASVSIIKSSACALGSDLAKTILYIVKDTTSGVFAGWLTTAILHSSGAFDSIIVAFTSSKIMPLNLAVAALLGAEIGTTVTPLLVSTFGYIREKSKLTSSYYVTMSHFLYNLLTLMIFYPLELFFGFFSKLAALGSGLFVKMEWLELIPSLVDLITPWIPLLMGYASPWITLILGCATIILSLWGLERYMTALFSMPKSWNLIRATFTKPLRAFLAGLLFTILVPSTTVMVSILVPLAASGVISVEYYILPYILGANIGTVFDVMCAALATGDPLSLGVWLVHLSVNLIGAVIFFPLLSPFSKLARWSSKSVTVSPKITFLFMLVFHIVPIAVIASYFI